MNPRTDTRNPTPKALRHPLAMPIDATGAVIWPRPPEDERAATRRRARERVRSLRERVTW